MFGVNVAEASLKFNRTRGEKEIDFGDESRYNHQQFRPFFFAGFPSGSKYFPCCARWCDPPQQ
jgi:hypothetical protein